MPIEEIDATYFYHTQTIVNSSDLQISPIRRNKTF